MTTHSILPNQLGTEIVSAAEEKFDRWRRRSGFALAPIAMVVTWLLTMPHLSDKGAALSAILAAVGVLWITESVPLPVSALLGALLAILFGVADARTVLAPFADPIVFLFIGSFMLANAMMLHRLDRRIALAFLSMPIIAGKPLRVLAAMGFVTAFLSMWVSNTATTAMMLPIGMGVLQALHTVRYGKDQPLSFRTWPFATGFMLIIAYAASIGGIGTPVGSPPNLIGIGQLQKLANVNIGFFQWMALTIPMLVIMFIILVGLLWVLHPSPKTTHDASAASDLNNYLRQQKKDLGRWTAGQINTAIAFAVAVILWILPGTLGLILGTDHAITKLVEKRFPEAGVALLVACLLFCLPTNLKKFEFTMNWKEAARIDWGTILLFGGGLSLGALMFSTGVAESFGKSLTNLMGVQSLWGLTAVAIIVGIILSETTSNTASATMVVPIFIALAMTAGYSPVPPAIGAVLGASYGFMLPVSTPPNAIVYSSGLVPIPRMIRAGVIFDVLGFVIIFAGLRLLCPMLGLV